GDGLAPFRRPLRKPRLHAGAHTGDLLDVLRRQVPRPRAGGRTAASPLAGLPPLGRARCRVRREVGLGTGELVRAKRRGRRRVASASWLGGTTVVARDRSRAPRLP